MGPELPAEIDGTPQAIEFEARPAAELARSAAAVLTALLILGAAVLAWRRMAGALVHPLPPSTLALVATLLAVTAAAARTPGRLATGTKRTGARAWCIAIAVSIALIAIGLLLSLPGTSIAGRALFWGILAVEEYWAYRPVRRRRAEPVSISGSAPGPTAGPRQQRRAASRLSLVFRSLAWGGPWRWARRRQPVGPAWPDRSARRSVPAALSGEELSEGEVFQQIVRSRAADGGDMVAGWLRVPISAGQRNTSVHVAFCPPFARTPRLVVEQLAGPPARIKTVQLLPYGARFDLKLASQSEVEETLLVEFTAETRPAAPEDEPTAREPVPRPETRK